MLPGQRLLEVKSEEWGLNKEEYMQFIYNKKILSNALILMTKLPHLHIC